MYTSFAWGCDYGWNNHLKQINLDDLSFVCCVCNPLGRTRGCRLVLGVSLVYMGRFFITQHFGLMDGAKSVSHIAF